MSTNAPPTEDQLRAAFEELITGPPADPPASGIPSDTGLDAQTMAAIERAWEGRSPALVDAARQELAMQLDGTHAQEGDDEAMAVFDYVQAEDAGLDAQQATQPQQ